MGSGASATKEGHAAPDSYMHHGLVAEASTTGVGTSQRLSRLYSPSLSKIVGRILGSSSDACAFSVAAAGTAPCRTASNASSGEVSRHTWGWTMILMDPNPAAASLLVDSTGSLERKKN